MIGHAAAILAVMVQAGADPERPCMSPDEAGAGAAVMLPEMIDMLSRGCVRHLTPDAYLRSNGADLATRWRSESATQRPLAMTGVARMLPNDAAAAARQGRGVTALPPGATAMPAPAEMMPQLLQGLEQGLASKLNAETCKQASRFLESIAPLPAENVAQMVSAFLAFAITMVDKGDDGPPICRR